MFFRWSKNSKNTEGFSVIDDSRCFFFRGYVIWNHKLFFGNDFLPVLKNHIMNDELDQNIRQYNGLFNIVLIRNNSIKIYNDRWGGFPLYYYQGSDELVISNNWQRILPRLPVKKINQAAAVEMHTFGYVMGDKTLVEDIYEFPPHIIVEYKIADQQIKKRSCDYWQFHYPFNNHKKAKQLEKEFVDLWKQQIRVYTDFLLENNWSAYIPISGGLDSRLLLYYVDRAGINTNTMTYGASALSREIKTALKVLGFMHNVTGSSFVYYNRRYVGGLLKSDFDDYDQITCAHMDKNLLSMIRTHQDSFFIPGHDANYMAGENIKWQMQNWKSRDNIIQYIFKHKSSPMTSQVIKHNSDYFNILYESLQETIPEDDLISSFNRWNGEQRQRQYILRSSIMPLSESQKVLVPFFDYELMDFFIDLPLGLLFNQKLHINTQLKYLYEHDPELKKIKRGGKEVFKKVHINFIHEYYPKLLNNLKQLIKIPDEPQYIWHPSIHWNSEVLDRHDLPDYIDYSGRYDYYVNTRYLMTISEVKSVLA